MTSKIGQRIRSLISLSPIQGDSIAERSLERYRRIMLSAASAILARGISILTVVISVPLTLGYLGEERYALWATMSSVLALLAFADLGIGNGLVNAVARSSGLDERKSAQSYVSSALLFLMSIAGLLFVVFAVFYPTIAWDRIYNVSTDIARAEAGPATYALIICLLVGLPLSIVQRTLMGLQEAYIDNLWAGLGKVVALIAVLLCIAGKGSLPLLVLAMAGTPHCVTVLSGFMLFGRRQRWLRPMLGTVNSRALRRLLRLGFLYFVLQIAVTFAFSIDNLIIAQVLGAVIVPQYAIPVQLFRLASSPLATLLAPLWPAYSEALARGDINWVRKAFVRTLIGSLAILTLLSFILVALGPTIMRLWVGPQIRANTELLIALAIFTIVQGITSPLAMLLNGAEIVLFQVVCSILMAVSNVALSIWLTRHVGVSGPVWGSIISTCLFIVLPNMIFTPRMLARRQAIDAI